MSENAPAITGRMFTAGAFLYCLYFFDILSTWDIFCKAAAAVVSERDLFKAAREESAHLREHSACEDGNVNCTLSAWIESDFDPWQKTGITERMIERGLNS